MFGGQGTSPQVPMQGGISTPGGGQANLNTGQYVPPGQGTNGINPQTAAMLLSGDPGMTAYAKAQLEQNKPIAAREGAPVINPNTGQILFYAPRLGPGINPTFSNGRVTGAQQIPGYAEAASGIAGAERAATESAAAPYSNPVETVGPGGERVFTARPRYAAPYVIPQNIQAQRDAEAARIRFAENQPNGGGMIPSSSVLGGAPTLAQQEEMKTLGKGFGEQGTKVLTDASSAVLTNRQLDKIETLAQGFTPDKLAPLKQAVGEWMIAAKVATPDEVNKKLGNVADMAGLTGVVNIMVAKAVRSTDAQPAVRQIEMMRAAYPAIDSSPQGLTMLINVMRDDNNFAIAKLNAQHEWLQSHRSLDGFEANWTEQAKQLSPFGKAPIDRTIANPGKTQSNSLEFQGYRFPNQDALNRYKKAAGF